MSGVDAEIAPVMDAVARAWPAAQERWARLVRLAPPVPDPEENHLARIDLGIRQVFVGGRTILQKQLDPDCIEAILAHEIGHHLRYPGTLLVSARLRLMERQLVPFEGSALANLFCDLLINAELGDRMRSALIRIYQSFHSSPSWGRDRGFLFYLAIYESLWALAPGTLLGAPAAEAMTKAFPHYTADADLVAQDVFRLGPNLYTQFLFFLSVMIRYVDIPAQEGEARVVELLECDSGEPSPEDWAEALTPTAAEREAVDRARAEGWLSAQQADRMSDEESLARRVASLPGQMDGHADGVPEIMAAYYRRRAERHLIAPPPELVLGDAIVPTTLEEWDVGDPIAEIDWIATLRLRGAELGGIAPLRRERLAECEGADVPLWSCQLELYLDVSGSMPDPRRQLNPLTLAALVLAMGAIRAGGSVRALLFSSEHVRLWDWCRSELDLSRFLMHYIGGGTTFPFDVLEASVREGGTGRPVRVVITDSDFDRNHDSDPRHAAVFAQAIDRSGPMVLLLHAPSADMIARFTRAGAQVVPVRLFDDFPTVAAALGRALFDGGGR